MNNNNRKKQWLRIRLGILQMIHNSLFSILLLPILVFTVILWKERDKILAIFDVPAILFPVWKGSLYSFLTMIPIFTLILILWGIGNVTARKDEHDLQEAFDKHDLRNGSPILMSKKRIKGSNVIRREFYSSIPMKVWVDKQEYIADCMNVHFVEPLQYGGKSNGRRIVMNTAKGRKPVSKGDLYDDEL